MIAFNASCLIRILAISTKPIMTYMCIHICTVTMSTLDMFHPEQMYMHNTQYMGYNIIFYICTYSKKRWGKLIKVQIKPTIHSCAPSTFQIPVPGGWVGVDQGAERYSCKNWSYPIWTHPVRFASRRWNDSVSCLMTTHARTKRSNVIPGGAPVPRRTESDASNRGKHRWPPQICRWKWRRGTVGQVLTVLLLQEIH